MSIVNCPFVIDRQIDKLGFLVQKGLTGNQLKLFAVIVMTIDHIGAVLYPSVLWLRIVGRLAYPIFAYMIAEGCAHTHAAPKAATRQEYQKATGLECLFGALYLQGKTDRLNELFAVIIDN